jgi:4-amino-4-deoxy-L-arabinose transferase-like glycosyltransferase
MTFKHPTTIVLVAAAAALAVGFSRTPLWDEDEPRFAAIARAMVESGDWVVPIYNDTLAVDKPVLMHWCMAAAMSVFGPNEFAARLPSVLAVLLTALALLRAGRRWFDVETGVVAALAYVGCLLVGIEAHAATPDAILVALTAWATVLAAEPFLPDRRSGQAPMAAAPLPLLSVPRAAAIGALAGVAVVCKGPIGFVGPAAVILPWVGWLALERRMAAGDRLLPALVPAAFTAFRAIRPLTILAATLAVAGPWYVAVSLRTDGAWTSGFFFVHNVGRFLSPMEKHGGSVLFHPLTMLVGFYPWSCFLPLAIGVAGWRLWRRTAPPAITATLGLLLVWLVVWVGGFSAAATKLPNYILPAYPAAALLVAALGVEAARRAAAASWPHGWWLASGLGWLAFGGAATAATVIIAARHGMPGAEPAALVGLVPVGGAIAAGWLARRNPQGALAALVLTGLIYTALAVGPAGSRLAGANTLPALVREMQARHGGAARLGTYLLGSPNVVFYSNGHVRQFVMEHDADAAAFLRTGTDAILLVPENRYDEIAATLPAGWGVLGRARPIFRKHDVLAIGALTEGTPATARTAAAPEVTR